MAIANKFIILRKFFYKKYQETVKFIKKHPLSAFFVALTLLFLLIALGSIFNKPKADKPKSDTARIIHTYKIGESPKVTFQAKIEKEGVIKIVALAPGVVQDIYVSEGDYVNQGTQLLTMSTNYQGGNAPAVQAQMAQEQYQHTLNTYGDQKDLIQKQRDIANKTNDNSAVMRDIAGRSLNDSNNLINANQNVLDTLLTNLSQLEANNINGSNDSSIMSAKQLINQLQGGQNQLRQQSQTLENQSKSDSPQNQLQTLQKDMTAKQLDLQDKALTLNKEVTKLQADLAWVNAATMYPASPFAGTVQRIYVKPGQQVSPGTPLAEISSNEKHVTAVVSVPAYIAQNISMLETSDLYIGNTPYLVRPIFISSEATDGLLYTVIYPLDSDIPATDGSYVKIDVPVGTPNTGAAVPFVPIDAVYQTQDKAYLLVVKDNKAVTREVSLGTIFGSFVEITTGLKTGDQVILDRTVIDGEKVQIN